MMCCYVIRVGERLGLSEAFCKQRRESISRCDLNSTAVNTASDNEAPLNLEMNKLSNKDPTKEECYPDLVSGLSSAFVFSIIIVK